MKVLLSDLNILLQAKGLLHVNITNIPWNSNGTIYYVSVSSGNHKGDSLPASAKPVIISSMYIYKVECSCNITLCKSHQNG